MIRRFARKARSAAVSALGRAGFLAECERYLQDRRTRSCHENAQAQGVVFGAEAVVLNWRGEPARIRIGRESVILGELIIFPTGGRIRFGEACFLGRNSRVWSMSGVEIGNFCLISHNVSIMDTDSHEVDHREREASWRDMQRGLFREQGNIRSMPVRIGDHGWIGAGATILKGVTVGEGAIVAAGSVVTRDVAPFTLVAGNPARVLRSLRPAEERRLEPTALSRAAQGPGAGGAPAPDECASSKVENHADFG
ncbi:acyltransferase (plasmid) [Cereibacter azotoformans]|uniref:Acetyltransferase-like isoleucine patch superfamily enzyme n=1 Tax=Cereibacter azotoformans TaxID=43057 RepID=A0A2T5JUQ1_9RHOB|nr:acyltransferase [Cereibacter azotoformans]PTR13899.1 acetyltransferase-like isoleucine patch superfamily enzyme [Cereibacter azotoformans]